MKVLSIEDDPFIREVLRRAFEMWNAQWKDKAAVMYAVTLAEGLEQNAAFTPDVVLLDLGLHDSSSDETARAIPKFTGKPAPAVVVLTGNERAELITASFEHGADAYLSKSMVGKVDYLFIAILNAHLRRRYRPGYCRDR